MMELESIKLGSTDGPLSITMGKEHPVLAQGE